MVETKEKPDEDKDKSESKSLVEDAKVTAERIEKANAETKALLEEQKKIAAERALDGRADLVDKPKPETEDEKYKREAKKRYEGTGLDPTDDEAK